MLKKIRGFIVVCIVAVSLIGCGGIQPRNHTPVDLVNLASDEHVRFSISFRGNPVSDNPATWDEAYTGGTWLFNNGKYNEACAFFEAAEGMTYNEEAQRTCLVAAAISALGANDSHRFREIISRLNKGLERVGTFRSPNIADAAIKKLNKINR